MRVVKSGLAISEYTMEKRNNNNFFDGTLLVLNDQLEVFQQGDGLLLLFKMRC
jgi:hypothetical protein